MHDIARLAAVELRAPSNLDEIAGRLCIRDQASFIVVDRARVLFNERPQSAGAIVGAIAVPGEPEFRHRFALFRIEAMLNNVARPGVCRQSLSALIAQYGHAINIEAASVGALCHRNGKCPLAERVLGDRPRSFETCSMLRLILVDRDREETYVPALGPILEKMIPLLAHLHYLIAPLKQFAPLVFHHDSAIARNIIYHRAHARTSAERCQFHDGRLTARSETCKPRPHRTIGRAADAGSVQIASAHAETDDLRFGHALWLSGDASSTAPLFIVRSRTPE
ncbi:hypothetical protein ASD31_23250 [Rhizobium sp. Root482]|nr:hypothetical protein ASD31_23250 [Rhizobium sp. Root482]